MALESSNGGLPSLRDRLRFSGELLFQSVKEHIGILGPFLLIILGLSLGILSLSSQQSTAYAQTYTGTLAPGNATLSLPAQDATFVDVNLSVGACGLRLYPATATEWFLFNVTGDLPPNWIGCANRTAVEPNNVTNLILINGGPASLPYRVDVQATLLETPYDWVALPATAISLAGLLIFVPRAVMHEALRYRESFGEKKWRK